MVKGFLRVNIWAHCVRIEYIRAAFEDKIWKDYNTFLITRILFDCGGFAETSNESQPCQKRWKWYIALSALVSFRSYAWHSKNHCTCNIWGEQRIFWPYDAVTWNSSSLRSPPDWIRTSDVDDENWERKIRPMNSRSPRPYIPRA